MNTKSPTAVKLKDIDKSNADVSFHLFPQNVNEDGFLQRFVNENVVITPAWLDRSGNVVADGGGDCILGAKFQVIVPKKEPVKPVEKPAPKAKKPAPKASE
jgi:hypothetical protein